MARFLKSLKVWTGLDKVENLNNIIKHNGGLKKSIKKLYLQDDLKVGTLIGSDQFGNKYFENPYYFVPRNRWVEFNEKVGLEYNASMVPPEWHRWLTHMTEYPPTVDKPVSYPWMQAYQPNMTGTSESYMPFNTVKPKIQAWDPSRKPSVSTPKLSSN